MYVTQGEVREVGIEINNLLGQDFTIDASEYEILKTDGDVIETGQPTMDGHKLIALFSATEKGRFYVWFKYHIGPEILKAKILVEVN
ncbi:hypothetical protein [Clostridium sp. DL1XJH146]